MSKWYDGKNWRKWALLAALAAAIAAGSLRCRESGAGQQGATNRQEPPGGLCFDTTAIEQGEIRSGLPFSCQFAFANAGKNTVEVVEARPGCGCLKPRLEKCLFSPGERGAIPLEVHTLGQAAGPHTWHLTVLYRDGEQTREQALEIGATVVTEVSVQPASLTLFTDGVLSHDITVIDLPSRAAANPGRANDVALPARRAAAIHQGRFWKFCLQDQG